MGALWVLQCPGTHTSDTVHRQNFPFSTRTTNFDVAKTGTNEGKLMRGRLLINAGKGWDQEGTTKTLSVCVE